MTFRYTGLHDIIETKEKYVEKKIEHILETENLKTFVDIGASIGMYVFLMNSKLDNGDIFAFEPDVFRFDTLLKKIDKIKNKNNRIYSYNIAISNFDGISILYTGYNSKSGSLYKNGNPSILYDDNQAQYILVRKLDSLLLDRKIDLIKIDTEGSELDILKGAAGIIEKYHPHLIIEVHTKTNKEIKKFLSQYGYINEVLETTEWVSIEHYWVENRNV